MARRDAVPFALRRAQTFAYVAVALLFFSIVLMVMTRSSVASNLTDLLHEQDTTVAQSRISDVVPFIVYAAIGALLLVAIPEWGFASLLSHRRLWPRIVMVPIAILHVLVAAVVAVLVPLAAWQGWLLLAALVTGALLALVAAVRAFAPSVTAWLRDRHEDWPESDE